MSPARRCAVTARGTRGHYELLWGTMRLNSPEHGWLPGHLVDDTELTLVLEIDEEKIETVS